MARFFGTDQMSFTMTSGPPFAGSLAPSRTSARLRRKRRLAGLFRDPFRNSTVAGITQGEQIGRQAFAQYLQSYRP